MIKLSSKILLIIVTALAIIMLSLRNDLSTELAKIKFYIPSPPIRYIRVEDVFQYLSKDEIKTALQPLVTTRFFDADMQAIQKTVAILPWVKTVAVTRSWPDTIDIKVEEKIAYVRWGENALMTEQGEIFTPLNISEFKSLILLTGPKDQQLKVLEIMKGVMTVLADRSVTLSEFEINNRWSWKIKLTTGLEILLGRDNQLKKLQRFLKTLNLLKQEQIQAMAVVDLRYPNGYAVSWKPGETEIDLTNTTTFNHPANAEEKEQ